jgi:hypothetical protein
MPTELVVCMRTSVHDFAIQAGVAQWPEQMIRNHQVVGSTPIPGSRNVKALAVKAEAFFIMIGFLVGQFFQVLGGKDQSLNRPENRLRISPTLATVGLIKSPRSFG